MSEESRPNPAADTLKEIQRLQIASQDALASFLAIQKRITEMQAQVIGNKDGSVILKPKE